MSELQLKSILEEAQDPEADIALLRAALSIESITGNETGFARFLGQEMQKLGLSVGQGEFLEGRENVWGSKDGDPNAPHLMFVGHTDTVHVRGWEDHWPGDARSNPFGAVEVDGNIWARGACDLKGGICAALAACRLLQKAGIELAGKLSFAFIGDEESGEEGTGVSAGAKDMVSRVQSGEIGKPDFAIYVEPTNLDVYTAQIGFFIADIRITGKTAYFGRPELGVDALKATHRILDCVWQHEAELNAGPSHDLVGASSILVTSIEGGGYIAVPGECKLSLIRKLRPGESLDDAVAAFEAVIKSAALDEAIKVQIDYPAGRDHPFGGSPVEISPDNDAVQMLSRTISDLSPSGGAIAGAPYWSEMPFLVDQIGCPTVYCAPGDISVAHTAEERINIAEYLAAIRSFAHFAVQYCGVRSD
ncbi:M20/M25/M40 family metallo-hydrolase [uncultured Cohaesibacter sp.]|uniref:M20 family metallopeptidase n=1 Tax=uncultured Cohaesibacter sp. TaxID=1002546 RepID=UPI0029C651C9|nr:M20/M25/M40 family metallo-hydrolase [uncultured Cohaesibacter sp.]